ncbi:TPR1-like CTLH-containing domain-containing protein [Entamoeba marina]
MMKGYGKMIDGIFYDSELVVITDKGIFIVFEYPGLKEVYMKQIGNFGKYKLASNQNVFCVIDDKCNYVIITLDKNNDRTYNGVISQFDLKKQVDFYLNNNDFGSDQINVMQSENGFLIWNVNNLIELNLMTKKCFNYHEIDHILYVKQNKNYIFCGVEKNEIVLLKHFEQPVYIQNSLSVSQNTVERRQLLAVEQNITTALRDTENLLQSQQKQFNEENESLMKKKMCYKLAKVNKDKVKIQCLLHGELNKSIFTLDKHGRLSVVLWSNQSISSLPPEIYNFHTFDNNQTRIDGLTSTCIADNFLYGIFSTGTQTDLFHLKTKKKLLAICSSTNPPNDMVLCQDFCKTDNSIFCLGCANGDVILINIQNSTTTKIYNHSSSITHLFYTTHSLITSDSNGSIIITPIQNNLLTSPTPFSFSNSQISYIDCHQLIPLILIVTKQKCLLINIQQNNVVWSWNDLFASEQIVFITLFTTLKIHHSTTVTSFAVSYAHTLQFSLALSNGYILLFEPQNEKDWEK